MAFLRGECYIWTDESGFHFWAKDGYDGWDLSSWACYDDGSEDGHRIEGFENASGVSIREEVMDAFVMMRVAQLIYEGKVEEVIDRAANDLEFGGNTGGKMLQRNAAKLKDALSRIKLDDAEPYVWKRDETGKVIFD
ncbi:MAG TPA: hypothetical protein VF627_08105 [Abditibacterium sp.]